MNDHTVAKQRCGIGLGVIMASQTDQEGSGDATKKSFDHRQPEARVQFSSRARVGCYHLTNSSIQTRSVQTEVVNRTELTSLLG